MTLSEPSDRHAGAQPLTSGSWKLPSPLVTVVTPSSHEATRVPSWLHTFPPQSSGCGGCSGAMLGKRKPVA
jgi:hypothetical protein